MDDDSRILREFQRLSVGAFDDSFKHSLAKEHNKPRNTFNSLHVHNSFSPNVNSPAIEKYFSYIHSDNDHARINPNSSDTEYIDQHNIECDNFSDEISIDYIINDLQRRKEYRLRKQHHNGLIDTNHNKFSRFMLAAKKKKQHTNDTNPRKYSKETMDKNTDIINNQNNEIQSLQTQLDEKEQIIKSLESKLQRHNHVNVPKFNGHRRQKSVTQAHTEQSTLENVRWSLRSEITKMTAAENDVNRLLQSVGDTSMIHDRLKKIHDTISVHKRKVSALEQSLQIDAFQPLETLIIVPDEHSMDTNNGYFDESKFKNVFMEEEMKDFEILSKEYSKLKIEMAEMTQEQQEWNNTKQELQNVNKRCNNLMNMLDKLSDEKLQLTLQIEDLYAFLNRNNLVYKQQQ